jgi:transcriptional regulator with XRE-family HTH domain
LKGNAGPTQEDSYLQRLADLFKVPIKWLSDKASENGNGQAQAEFPTLTIDEAQWLGARAKARREELDYSRNEMTKLIGASAINLLTWEKSLPRKRRTVESKWEEALRVPEGWLRSNHLKAFLPPPFPVPDGSQGLTVSREMRAVCSWLSRKNPYHRTVDYDALNESEKRMADIMLFRFGVFGEEESTLQRIGDRIGLTRERVRQIGEDFIAR